MTTQASFIAYDMLDRVRANSAANYSFSGLDQRTGALSMSGVQGQDLSDFKRHIRQFGGASAKGDIALSGNQVSITLKWDDSRATHRPGSFRTFTLISQIAPDVAGSAS